MYADNGTMMEMLFGWILVIYDAVEDDFGESD
jgi:hypothetical protein